MSEQTPAQRIKAEARAATRQALIEAGVAEMIANGGAEVPTIDAVCRRAGYTRGAFYFYFDDYEQFLAEMLEWLLGRLEVMTATTGDSNASIADVIAGFGSLVASGAIDGVPGEARGAYLSIMRGLRPGSHLRDSHAQLMAEATERLAERVRNDQEAGRIRKDVDSVQIARTLQLVAVGLVMWSDIDISIELEPLAQTVLGLLEPA